MASASVALLLLAGIAPSLMPDWISRAPGRRRRLPERRHHLGQAPLELPKLVLVREAQDRRRAARLHERHDLLDHRVRRPERQPGVELLGADRADAVVAVEELDRLALRALGVVVDVDHPVE